MLPRAVAYPAAAFLAVCCLSLLWADETPPGEDLLGFFLLPFGALLAVVGRSPMPASLPRQLGQLAVALATLFAVVGLYQAVTQQLFFFAPNVQTANANGDFFRVTSLFVDPSLYGRHVVLGLGDRAGGARAGEDQPALGDRPGGRAVGRAAVLLLAVEHGRAGGGHAGPRCRHRRTQAQDERPPSPPGRSRWPAWRW